MTSARDVISDTLDKMCEGYEKHTADTILAALKAAGYAVVPNCRRTPSSGRGRRMSTQGMSELVEKVGDIIRAHIAACEPTDAIARAAIAAVVTALRDELLRGKSKAASSTMLTVHVRGLFEEILAPREGEYTGGMNDLNVSPPAPAPVCEREKALEENQRLCAEIELARRERDTALADVERLRQALRVLPFKDVIK
jgi:hypothetical protein